MLLYIIIIIVLPNEFDSPRQEKFLLETLLNCFVYNILHYTTNVLYKSCGDAIRRTRLYCNRLQY